MLLVSDAGWDPLSHLPFRGCHLPLYTTQGIDHYAPHLEEIPPKVTLENTREWAGLNLFFFFFTNEPLDELI